MVDLRGAHGGVAGTGEQGAKGGEQDVGLVQGEGLAQTGGSPAVYYGAVAWLCPKPYHGVCMPSFQDSAFLVLLALLLFGPKGLAKLARELGKLMGEFRRASNEFRVQMDEEFRLTEQVEQQKKIAAIEAAAPPAATPGFAESIAEPEHPHVDGPLAVEPEPAALPEATVVPIASSGGLDMKPPATGLPVGRTSGASLGSVFESVPQVPAPEEVSQHG